MTTIVQTNLQDMTADTMTEEDAKAMAEEFVRVDAVATKMKKILKEYVEKHGALEAGGMEFSFSPTNPSWEFAPDKMKDFFTSVVIDTGSEVNPWSLVTVPAASLKILRKYGWNDDSFEMFAKKVEKNPQFRPKKSI